MKGLWNNNLVRWLAPFVWMGLFFGLSAQPTLPDLTHGRADLQDIAGHLTIYAVLALLWERALRGAGVRRAGWWAFAIAVLYGVSDEFHQRFVPNRAPDLFDVATDAVGAAAALASAAWLRARRRRTRARSSPKPASSQLRPAGGRKPRQV